MGFLHENIILPLSDIFKGEQSYRYLKLLKKSETWNDTQLMSFQENKLRKLFKHIASNVPYYRDWFNKNNIDPNTINLSQLPIIDKALMRKEGIAQFTAKGFPKHQRLTSRSSGSTGEPFTFYESKLSYSVNIAAKLRTWYQAGYRLGDRYMKITNGVRSSKLKALQDRINNCVYVPFYSITDDTLKSILEQIEQSKPRFIRSYPAPLYLLAQYRNHHEGFHHCPLRIFTTGSTLPTAYREEIEHAFGCDVIDSYSCEGTPNTYETTSHDGYHISGYYGIIEVIDNHNQPVRNGIGRVVSTDLWNLAHPFVRYDTQDLVEVKDGKIVRIIGRQCECLLTMNGQTITIHNLTTFFASRITSVNAYRLVRKKNGTVEFQLTVDNNFDDKAQKTIVDYWSQLLGLPVSIRIVDDIPMMHNNKYLTIIDETTD